MSDDKTPAQTELETLKAQASLMGIQFSNNIGVEALKRKIAAKMDDQVDTTDAEGNAIGESNPLAGASSEDTAKLAADAGVTSSGDDDEESAPLVPQRMLTLSEHLKAEATKLVRIRISCMDPKKQDLPGEFFTVANDFIGTIKKFVPFGEQTDNGYHVPFCIYEFLRERKFLHVQTRTVDGQIETKHRWVKEFSIELLEPLSRAELSKLAADQRATGRLDGDE